MSGFLFLGIYLLIGFVLAIKALFAEVMEALEWDLYVLIWLAMGTFFWTLLITAVWPMCVLFGLFDREK